MISRHAVRQHFTAQSINVVAEFVRSSNSFRQIEALPSGRLIGFVTVCIV